MAETKNSAYSLLRTYPVLPCVQVLPYSRAGKINQKVYEKSNKKYDCIHDTKVHVRAKFEMQQKIVQGDMKK